VHPEARDVQNISPGAELAGEWWQLFHSAQLDEVVRAAIAASPTLVAANATLAGAREEVTVARGALLPSVSATAGAQRAGTGAIREPGTGATANLYSIGLSTSYNLDIFGGTRRAVEQQQALADFQRNELAAAYLTLTGNLVNEVLIIASTRLQIATTEELIASDRKNLALTQRAFDVGTVPRSDVLTADTQLAADLTQLPSLHKQLDQAYDALAVLSGRAPSEWQVRPFDIEQFTPPRDIPLSLPARLVRQRPDVLAAEMQLHAASAAIGVAIAQELPDISLSASITREALRAADLFHQFDTLWGAGGSLTQPLFKGGALRAQVRAARDTFRAEAATYQAVVLEALGQVADDLWALQYDAQILTVDRHSMDVAFESLKLQQQSYSVGTTTVLNLIAAERTYAQARLSYVNARVQQLTDSASLLTALGGGWWNDNIEASAQ
jgi:NodT family efflux transporter outer membrane factor (OMF) lipoprotein